MAGKEYIVFCILSIALFGFCYGESYPSTYAPWITSRRPTTSRNKFVFNAEKGIICMNCKLNVFSGVVDTLIQKISGLEDRSFVATTQKPRSTRSNSGYDSTRNYWYHSTRRWQYDSTRPYWLHSTRRPWGYDSTRPYWFHSTRRWEYDSTRPYWLHSTRRPWGYDSTRPYWFYTTRRRWEYDSTRPYWMHTTRRPWGYESTRHHSI